MFGFQRKSVFNGARGFFLGGGGGGGGLTMTIDSICQMIMTLYLYRFVLKCFTYRYSIFLVGFFFILMFVVVVLLVLGRMGKLQKVKKRVGHRMSQFRNTWYNMSRQPDCAPRKGNNVCIPLNKPLLVLFVFWPLHCLSFFDL